MLGVIIGVASVVALVGVGQGTTSNITNRLNGLGTNLLTISPTGQSSGGTTTLTLDDADAIAEARRRRGRRAGAVDVARPSTAGTNTTDTTVVGTTADYATVRAYDVWQGTFLTDVAVDRGLRVAVLGATTADDLGLERRPSARRSASAASRSRSSASSSRRAAPASRTPTTRSLVPVGDRAEVLRRRRHASGRSA